MEEGRQTRQTRFRNPIFTRICSCLLLAQVVTQHSAGLDDPGLLDAFQTAAFDATTFRAMGRRLESVGRMEESWRAFVTSRRLDAYSDRSVLIDLRRVFLHLDCEPEANSTQVSIRWP